MKMNKAVAWALSLAALLFAWGVGCTAVSKQARQEVPRMPVDELKSLLNDPNLVLIDVRAAGDWEGSSAKIKGALREVYEKTDEWASKYDKEKTIVLYCA